MAPGCQLFGMSPSGFTRTYDRYQVHTPDHLFSGFAGWIRLSPRAANSSQIESVIDCTRNWQDDTSAFAIRGDGERAVSSGGWEVYTLGESRCAKAVAALLDEAKLEEKRNAANQLSLQACRELSWKLLPRTVVVAIHRPTGTACLLRDGWGFTCLYYCVRGDSVIFSTCLAALRSVASSTSINTDKLSEMLLYGHRGGNRTVWQEVNVVAPGYTVCCYRGDRLRCESLGLPECLFDQGERHRLEQQSVADTANEIDEALAESLAPIRAYTRLAVPCGGGVDSSLLGAYLARRDHKVTFWSINQPEADRREADWLEPILASHGYPSANW